MEHRDEHIVQHHIGHTRRDRVRQPQLGPLRHHKKALKADLEHERNASQQKDPPIYHAVPDQRVAGPRQPGNGLGEPDAHHSQHAPQQDHGVNNHGEVPLSQLPAALSQCAGHDRAAPRPQHEAEGPDDHSHGEDDIDGRESHISHQIGDEQAVHHAVNRGDHHHHHRRQGEPQQPPVCKMV